MNARFTRQRDGHSSTESSRQRSQAFDLEITKRAFPDTALDFVLRASLLPIGQRALETIIDQSAWSCEEEWLQLESKAGPTIAWNTFRGFTAPANLKATIEEGTLLNYLQNQSIYDFRSKSPPVRALGKLLEGNLSDYFSPAIIGYVNATLVTASPVRIDFDMTRGIISEETRKREIVASRFPAFFRTTKSLREALNGPAADEHAVSIDRVLDVAESTAENSEDRDATHWLVRICREDKNRKRLLENAGVKGFSLLRNLSSLPSLLLRLYDPQDEPFPYTTNHTKAAKLLYIDKEVAFPKELADRLKEEFRKGYLRPSSLKVTLVGFNSVREHYGLNAGYPPLSDTGCCARRAILLVTSCGRRLSCMFGVSPEGYIEDEKPFLILGRTKVKQCADFRLPLGSLLPPSDQEFIREWLHSLSDSDRTKTLFELAGIDRSLLFGKIEHAKIHNAYADLLCKDFGWSKRPRLHDLRRMGITWLSIRLSLAQNRDLSIPSFLARQLSNPLFSKEALQEFGDYSQFEDPLDFIAKVAGHASRVTTRKNYNFSLPVHTAIEARTKWERIRESVALAPMKDSIDRLFS